MAHSIALAEGRATERVGTIVVVIHEAPPHPGQFPVRHVLTQSSIFPSPVPGETRVVVSQGLKCMLCAKERLADWIQNMDEARTCCSCFPIMLVDTCAL
jgi:hypothetical protein